MDIYKTLALTVAPGKEEPDVWISRLVIFEKLVPEPEVIREVKLSRGMNIVWAEEPDGDDTAAEITGHSAGKTSFCRLLRYILGEKTFGNKTNAKLIQEAIPRGYVAAELHVCGKQWAVRRPFDKTRRSYIRPDASIEELLDDRTQPVGQDEYVERLGLKAYVEPLETATVVRTDQMIEWGHVLAWCSRDQEARFQNSYDWRSARSESEWPSFRASKADALFVMRAILGLFLPEELKAEEELASLLKTHEELEAKIIELRREPNYRVNLHTDALRAVLREVLPRRSDIDTLPLHSGNLLPDLTNVMGIASTAIKAELDEIGDKLKENQDQIDVAGAEARQLRGERESFDALFGITDAASVEIDAAIGAREKQRTSIKEVADRMCPWGGVLINKCDYVIRRQETLKITQLQDIHAMDQAEAVRREELARITDQKKQADSHLAGVIRTLEALRKGRQELQKKANSLDEKLTKLKDAHADLVTWTGRHDTPGEFPALGEVQASLAKVQKEIQRLNAELSSLLAKHSASRDLIASIFSASVRAVLSSGTYEGMVGFEDRELRFQITHGATMSGEAVETLSVLLADVACLVYSTVIPSVRLPGFLLHDSPREADLGLRLYRSFIRLVAGLQSHFGTADACPFQYVLTTTTAPPEELRDPRFVKLHLDASKPSELLFCRSLAMAAKQQEEPGEDDDGFWPGAK